MGAGIGAVLQATCVDATVTLPGAATEFLAGVLRLQRGHDLGPEETVLGFPAAHFDALVDALERLRATTIPRSRAKKPCELFVKTHGSSGNRQA